MLLSNAKRLKIQGIIKRIAQDKSITLEERIYVEKFANHNSTISLWLKKANSFRRNGTKKGYVSLMISLGLISSAVMLAILLKDFSALI